MQDVIIIGGGPAGSVLGSYLSMAGISNLIVEKAIHPRPHVGESLVTSTTRIFDDIGFLPTMEKEGFVRKYGATWHSPLDMGKLGIEFAEFPQEGVNQPYTYHVDRSRFDLCLLKHAESLGSKVMQGVAVSRVLFDDMGKANGVLLKVGDQTVKLSAKIVVDASGRATLLGRQLRLKRKDPLFNQYAIHSWFENVGRGDDSAADHIHIYFLPTERGWVWQIPITETITSVGVVTEKEQFKQSRLDIDAYFKKHLATNRNLLQAMSEAKQVNDYEVEGDYSYSLESFVGDGWLTVGDAARFVDPIFSSGVSVAAYSAKFASERIIHALQINDFRKEVFLPYQEMLRDGCDIWYEFILLYYKLLPMFTYFIKTPQYRMQILRLLQGEVFEREEVPVLKAMRQMVETVENAESHLLKSTLTDLPLDAVPNRLTPS